MAADTLLHNIDRRVSDLQFQLQYLLQPIEKQRLEVKRRLKIYKWSLLATVLILGILAWLVYQPLLWGYIAVFIGFIIFYALWISPKENALIEEFNSRIVPQIISEFLEGHSFVADSCIDSSDYYCSDLYKTGVDRYTGSSFVSGSLGETFLEFSKLHTEYKTETRSKNGGKKTTWHTIFKGVFLIADSNKHFNGQTYIFPDTAERLFGGIGRWMQEKFGSGGRGELVYLEDPAFEKRFVVYATDAVEARYLLTPSMQHYFVELAKSFGKKSIKASFIDGKLYLAISGNFQLFSFKMNMCVTDKDTVKYYVENLIRILSVIEILDLNTRVWGK